MSFDTLPPPNLTKARPRLSDAMDLVTGDMASNLVPFPRMRPIRTDSEILQEIQRVVIDTHTLAMLAPLDAESKAGFRHIVGLLLEELGS